MDLFQREDNKKWVLLRKRFIYTMQTTLNIDDILYQVKKLDKKSQQILLDRLLMMVRQKKEKSSQTMLSSIAGVGAEIWADTDIDEYLETERQW